MTASSTSRVASRDCFCAMRWIICNFVIGLLSHRRPRHQAPIRPRSSGHRRRTSPSDGRSGAIPRSAPRAEHAVNGSWNHHGGTSAGTRHRDRFARGRSGVPPGAAPSPPHRLSLATFRNVSTPPRQHNTRAPSLRTADRRFAGIRRDALADRTMTERVRAGARTGVKRWRPEGARAASPPFRSPVHDPTRNHFRGLHAPRERTRLDPRPSPSLSRSVILAPLPNSRASQARGSKPPHPASQGRAAGGTSGRTAPRTW